jgi:hypothetical protein
MSDRFYRELVETLPWLLLGWGATIGFFMALILGYRRISKRRIDLDTIFALSMIFSVIFFSTFGISAGHIVEDPWFYLFYAWGYVADLILNLIVSLPFWLICGPLYFIYLKRLMGGRKLCSARIVYLFSLLVFSLEYWYASTLFAGS